MYCDMTMKSESSVSCSRFLVKINGKIGEITIIVTKKCIIIVQRVEYLS